jgi:hypothetical protein
LGWLTTKKKKAAIQLSEENTLSGFKAKYLKIIDEYQEEYRTLTSLFLILKRKFKGEKLNYKDRVTFSRNN